MITMSNFGKMGRLGNQLFQYAFLFALAKEKNTSFFLPPNVNYYKTIANYSSSSSIFDCFNIKKNIIQQRNKFNLVKEKHFHYDETFPNAFPDNADYSGYFQSPKYFEAHKNELLKMLQFKTEVIQECNSGLDYSNLVSLHVRRGDYVNNKAHPVVNIEYIEKAKSLFTTKKFLVFSDDIEWCKKNNIGDLYASNKTDCVDLYQMSLCSSSIISNSTFSWWGAYLGQPKEKIIAPLSWFNKAINTNDIYCKNWIKI